MIWLQFIFSGIVIVLAAIQLAKYADAIALRTGLGRLFIGALLLSSVTSLPEVLTTINSFSQGVPNLAAGNLVGSNMFNMLLIAVADLASRKTRILRKIAMRHALSGSLTMLLITLVVFFIVANIDVQIGWVGLDSIIIVLAYVSLIKILQSGSVVPLPVEEEELDETVPTMLRAVIGFSLAALVLVFISPLLVSSSTAIAEVTGLGTSFVGTTLVAMMTSLPEVVATISLVRMGAEDMAIGNLFGSNMFNMFAMGLVDFFYLPGRFFGVIDPSFVIVGLLGLIMTGLALVGNLAKLERRIFSLEIDATLIVLVYFGGLAFLYSQGIAP